MKPLIVYIGTSDSIIRELVSYGKFQVQTVICEYRRLTESYREQVNLSKLDLKTFNSKEEFRDLINSFEEKTKFLIYQLDFIVIKELVDKYCFYNFHSGSVKTNRGAHPIIRTILNNEKETEFTLHKINHKIDQGFLISLFKIEVDSIDSVEDIKIKMELGLPSMFNDLLACFQSNSQLQELNGGEYYKPISQEDFTINSMKDEIIVIKNKIRSQKNYQGAILICGGKRYFITELYDLNNEDNISEKITINNNFINVERQKVTFKLRLNLAADELD